MTGNILHSAGGPGAALRPGVLLKEMIADNRLDAGTNPCL